MFLSAQNLQNIDFGYSLEPPQLSALEYIYTNGMDLKTDPTSNTCLITELQDFNTYIHNQICINFESSCEKFKT